MAKVQLWAAVEITFSFIIVSLPSLDYLLIRLVPSFLRTTGQSIYNKGNQTKTEFDELLELDPRLIDKEGNSFAITIKSGKDISD